MMVLGFLTGSLYVLRALRASGGDWERFWLGARRGGRPALGTGSGLSRKAG
jgi:hypothetical protein